MVIDSQYTDTRQVLESHCMGTARSAKGVILSGPELLVDA